MNASTGSISVLEFETAGVGYLVPAARVTAILEPSRLHRVPRARAGVAGFVERAGRLMPVIEVAPGALKGMNALVFVGDEQGVALPCSRVVGVREVALDSAIARAEEAGELVIEAEVDGKMLAVLSPALLVSRVWLQTDEEVDVPS